LAVLTNMFDLHLGLISWNSMKDHCNKRKNKRECTCKIYDLE
jgi:hypothetical protein